jgi:hypothetical protein
MAFNDVYNDGTQILIRHNYPNVQVETRLKLKGNIEDLGLQFLGMGEICFRRVKDG